MGPAKPLWKQPIVTVLAILALLGAGLWFAFEMRASSRRREWMPQPTHYAGPPGWNPVASEDSIALAQQLVRLTDVVVQLVASHRDGHEIHRDDQEFTGERARARSPGFGPVDASPPPSSRFESDDLQFARAGPEPPEPGSVQPPLPFTDQPEAVRSAFVAPGDSPRPEPVAAPAAAVATVVGEPVRESIVAPPPVLDPGFEPMFKPVDDVVPPPVLDPGFEPMFKPLTDDDPAHAAAPEPTPEPSCARTPESTDGAADPREAMLTRLRELDRQRRRLREWMDAEEAGEAFGRPDASRPGNGDDVAP